MKLQDLIDPYVGRCFLCNEQVTADTGIYIGPFKPGVGLVMCMKHDLREFGPYVWRINDGIAWKAGNPFNQRP